MEDHYNRKMAEERDKLLRQGAIEAEKQHAAKRLAQNQHAGNQNKMDEKSDQTISGHKRNLEEGGQGGPSNEQSEGKANKNSRPVWQGPPLFNHGQQPNQGQQPRARKPQPRKGINSMKPPEQKEQNPRHHDLAIRVKAAPNNVKKPYIQGTVFASNNRLQFRISLSAKDNVSVNV